MASPRRGQAVSSELLRVKAGEGGSRGCVHTDGNEGAGGSTRDNWEEVSLLRHEKKEWRDKILASGGFSP